MKKTCVVILVSLAFIGLLFPEEKTKRPMTTDDSLNMVQVGNALISPDGNWVFFSKSELDWKKNKRTTTYYKVPASGGEAFQYIGEDGGNSFQFSPDGKYLTFKRSVDKISQIFSDYKTPPDVYLSPLDQFSPLRLTDANSWIEEDILLADMKVIHWKSSGPLSQGTKGRTWLQGTPTPTGTRNRRNQVDAEAHPRD